jgi:hypothetical protein
MIKSLNIIVGETTDGKLKVIHLGKDRGKAQAAFEKARADDYECLIHLRNPAFERRKFPLKAKRFAAEYAAGIDADPALPDGGPEVPAPEVPPELPGVV